MKKCIILGAVALVVLAVSVTYVKYVSDTAPNEQALITITEPNKAAQWVIGENIRIVWSDELGRHSEKDTHFRIVLVPETGTPTFGYVIGVVSNQNFLDWDIAEYEECGMAITCAKQQLPQGRYFLKIQVGPTNRPTASAQSAFLVEIVSK
jgi:hypothetical protein